MKEILRAAIVIVASLLLAGCSIFPDPTPKTMLKSANAYAFYEARYERQCVNIPAPKASPDCIVKQTLLVDWLRWLGETTWTDKAQTKQRVGPRPLFLKQLVVCEKDVAKVLK